MSRNYTMPSTGTIVQQETEAQRAERLKLQRDKWLAAVDWIDRPPGALGAVVQDSAGVVKFIGWATRYCEYDNSGFDTMLAGTVDNFFGRQSDGYRFVPVQA